jgi:Bacterial Ig domain
LKFAVRAAVVLMALTVSSFAAITMTSPANGSSTISPVHVMAQANPNGAAPIAQIQVYLDGQVAYQAKSNTVDTYVNAAAGPHTIVVKAWDSAGGQMTQQAVVNGTGTGIFVGTPGPGATVNGATQVTASATSAASITAMQVYDNGTSIYQTQGGSINTSVNLAPGGHYLVINAWDASGAVYSFPLNLAAPAQAIAQVTAPVAGASQVEIPSNATTIANIDQLPNWQSCSACAGLGGNGPQDPYSMTQGVANPAMDGASATFWLGGTVPFGDALWWNQLAPNPNASHFVYDLYFWVSNPAVAQGLEFDVNQSVGGMKYIFGTECDARTNGGWRIWDTANAGWVSTGATCTVQPNAWNHLTWQVERVGNQTHFIAVTLNGTQQTIDKYFNAENVNAQEINVAFQLDGDEHQDALQAWLDKVTLYYW